MELLPDEPGARTQLAFVLNAMNRSSEATEVLEAGLARTDQKAPFHIALGAIAVTNGNHEFAGKHLAAAAKISPDNHDVAYFRERLKNK